MNNQAKITVNGKVVPIEGEKNLLSLIRKSGVEMPTFCYHSELSVYGACRLCIVDIEGRGIDTSCSTPPRDGMVIKTHTPKLRKMRKTLIELLLANHDTNCTSCDKSSACKLKELASDLGVKEIPYKRTREHREPDLLSPSLLRYPDKCVLCGDCVRYCNEIQGVGAIDFAYRGEDVVVTPAFNKSLAHVDCINCGQCAAVCPTGAIVVKSEITEVWDALADDRKTVIAQIAPAVRASLGEMFDMPPSAVTLGKIMSALKYLGFKEVYDTSFGADLTVMEETNEYLERRRSGDRKTMFTSCCPAWVKYAEQFHPELLPQISSCMSPQGMVGSLSKKLMAQTEEKAEKDIIMVSIMPCTAKKFEKERPELSRDGVPLIDYVLTTQELGKMIKEAGIVFKDIAPAAADLPFGLYSEAGLGFGASQGVSEAVARYAARSLNNKDLISFEPVENETYSEWKEVIINDDNVQLKMAIAAGLKNTEKLIEKINSGEVSYDIVEVMACPGGCVDGAGQPVSYEEGTTARRKEALKNAGKITPVHSPEENPYIQRIYEKMLGGKPGSHEAHELVHTGYQSRKRIENHTMELASSSEEAAVEINVCVGTSCFLRGSQDILSGMTDKIEQEGWKNRIDLKATFCSENCSHGPTVTVGDRTMNKSTLDSVVEEVEAQLGIREKEGVKV
ncbi:MULTISPECIES: [FeFe] hydrogenase, group A [unclassified Oceanispirochaeta]|uniref:[FeFe] hydrogenase, group A n=1 Tax=unclassified Oceanispirochaeta TaxID=2635722 RepID=UPI000E08E7FE|nr:MULTISPECIES: [FeFe] hydrogenase, group A [unclassified Oceanispirochaeta]MBF9017735.1 iron hydrogenase small subunit [Oceanispirochaeta sp. M2]NPD72138.1 4Fe-4S dicluster domain-containing protein [Oceanispirochaeta sp. M1]RDG32580.1 4Fe-4S dicluster domain-containing protein [Oceanispirochaeta sp. M1]